MKGAAQSPPTDFAATSELPREYIRRETLDRIDHFLAKPKLRVYLDLKGMCERVSDSYRDRVVVELLQNAHDAHPQEDVDGRIYIAFDPSEGHHGTLYVANDGNGFARENFDALCSPTLTTKGVNEAIGNKGVGFLSVFQVCSHPEIYSRLQASSESFDGYCFAFAADAMLKHFLEKEKRGGASDRVIANMPRLYLACPIEDFPASIKRLAGEGFATAIRLPMKSADAQEAVLRQLRLLTAEAPPVQLFLPRIRELRVSCDPLSDAIILSRDCKECAREGDVRVLKVRCGTRAFVIAEKRIAEATIREIIECDIAGETLPEAWASWTGDAIVSLAVAADGDPIAPRLYNFLPMGEGAEAPFAGYLDAPFFATLDRQRVQSGVGLNEYLLETAQVLAIEGAELARSCLAREEAQQAVLDLVLWSDEEEEMLDRILTSECPLIPTIAKRGQSAGWARFDQARLWHGTEFLNPQRVARHASLLIVDDEIGTARLDELERFVAGTELLVCDATLRADLVEQVADRRKRAPNRNTAPSSTPIRAHTKSS